MSNIRKFNPLKIYLKLIQQDQEGKKTFSNKGAVPQRKAKEYQCIPFDNATPITLPAMTLTPCYQILNYKHQKTLK